MLSAFAVLLLTAQPVKLAMPGLTLVGVDNALADVWIDRFVERLGESGDLKVSTSRDIGALLGVERQKQLLGCDAASSSCVAELAGALGVEALLIGSLALVEGSYTVTLRVIRSGDAQVISTASARLTGVRPLQDWLDEAAVKLRDQVVVSFRGAPVAAGRSWAPWVVGGAGVASVAVGAVLLGVSAGNAGALAKGTGFQQPADVQATASAGRTLEGAGVGLLVAGGAAVAASAVWLWVTREPAPAAVSLAPIPGGAALAIGGVW